MGRGLGESGTDGRPGRLIGASAAALFVLAAASACAGIGGTANPATSTTAAAASSSAPASSSTATNSSATSSSAATSSSGSASSAPVAVLGLPHSAPLPTTVLLATRIENGTADLYQIDTVTGALGKKLTNGTPGPQFPILSPDRGSVVYVQSGPKTQLRTMAVDGTGNRDPVSYTH